MPDGVPPVFVLDSADGNAHRFNQQVIGRGRVYPNEIPADDRCIVRVVVGILHPQFADWNLLCEATSIACHVNTDAKMTVLQGEVAEQLHLRPVDPFVGRIATHIGMKVAEWSRHMLWVHFGPGLMPLEVWFPVERNQYQELQWRRDRFPEWNVLGMHGVLDQRMVCVTPNEVYAFELLEA